MGFERLQLASSVAKILAIIPWSENKECTRSQKMHSFVMVIVMIATFASCMVFRNFYLNNIWIKLVVCFLSDLSLLAVNLVSIVNLPFRKRNQWNKLVDNLWLTKCEGATGKMPHYLNLSFNVCYVLLCLFQAWLWINAVNLSFFLKIIFVSFFQNYCQIIYGIVLWEIIDLLLQRYKQVTKLLVQNTPKSLRRATHLTHILNETTDIFNEVFGWSMNLIILFTSLKLLNNIDHAYVKTFQLRLDGKFLGMMMCDLITAAYTVLFTGILIFKCDELLREAIKILDVCRSLTWDESRNGNREEVEEVGELVSKHLPRITAARFFDINRTTLLQILWSVVSIFIVMVQFRASLKAH